MATPIRILVDMNVILDVVQQRQPFYEDSAKVLDAVSNQEVEGYLAAHSITTLFYVITRFQNRTTAVSILQQLLTAFKVTTLNDAIIREALTWGWQDFEDAVQMATAVHSNLDYLVTRNPKDFETHPVPILKPAHLPAILSSYL